MLARTTRNSNGTAAVPDREFRERHVRCLQRHEQQREDEAVDRHGHDLPARRPGQRYTGPGSGGREEKQQRDEQG